MDKTMTELDDLKQSLDKLDQKTSIERCHLENKFMLISYNKASKPVIESLLKQGYVVSSIQSHGKQETPNQLFVRKASAKSNKVEHECPECGGDGKIVEETTELAFEK